MAPSTQQVAVSAALTTVAGAAVAVGYLYRQQIQDSSAYQTVSQQATAAAAKSGEALKAVQASAAASYSSVAASVGAATTTVAAGVSSATSTVAAGVTSATTTVAVGVSAATTKVSGAAADAYERVQAYLKQAKSKRTLRRVRSFPVVITAEEVCDVAAAAANGKDQKKKSPRKVKSSPKKATGEPAHMGVPVQVMAK